MSVRPLVLSPPLRQSRFDVVGWDAYAESFFAQIYPVGARSNDEDPLVVVGYGYRELESAADLAEHLAAITSGRLSPAVLARLEADRVIEDAGARKERLVAPPRRPRPGELCSLERAYGDGRVLEVGIARSLEIHDTLSFSMHDIAVGTVRLSDPVPPVVRNALADGLWGDGTTIRLLLETRFGRYTPLAIGLLFQIEPPSGRGRLLYVHIPVYDLEALRHWAWAVRRQASVGFAAGPLGSSERLVVIADLPDSIFLGLGTEPAP